MTADPGPSPESAQDHVLGPLVRVIQEAVADAPWALIGASALRLQGVETPSANLEFITSEKAITALGEMLGVPSDWGQGTYLVANRLHFMRHGVPVFVFGDPVFHGPYDSLAPREIPSLWDALRRVEVGGVPVLCTPLEWEIVLAVVLGQTGRAELLRDHMRANEYDSRLVVRLLREGRVASHTEEALWALLEQRK